MTQDAEDILRSLDKVLAVQRMDGIWNCDDYMHGMANGLILARSFVTGEDPQFLYRAEKGPSNAPPHQ